MYTVCVTRTIGSNPRVLNCKNFKKRGHVLVEIPAMVDQL